MVVQPLEQLGLQELIPRQLGLLQKETLSQKKQKIKSFYLFTIVIHAILKSIEYQRIKGQRIIYSYDFMTQFLLNIIGFSIKIKGDIDTLLYYFKL